MFKNNNVTSVFEVHYNFNGIKRWDLVHARSEASAIEKILNKHDYNNVDIDAVFEYSLKSFKHFNDPIFEYYD